jgi:hypothetical protein
VVATVLAMAPAADASTASVQDGVLTVTGGPTRDNLGVFQYAADDTSISVTDPFMTVTAGPGCQSVSEGMVQCPLDTIRSVVARLGEADDTFASNVRLPVSAFGEAGDDHMVKTETGLPGLPQPVSFDGGDGIDRLVGGAADDVLAGGPGDDGLDGGDGNDVIDPGPGRDTVSDLSGDDRFSAVDGTSDYVNCGPGTDTGDFDPTDQAVGCELGSLPPPPKPDCTPEVDPPRNVSLRTLQRRRYLTVRASVERACVLRVRLLSADRVLSRATASAHGSSVRVKVGSSALRRLRSKRRARIVVSGASAGAAAVTRTFSIRLVR